MFGKVFADRGYISAPLFAKLYSNGIQLITKLRKNMEDKLMDLTDKILLRKRAVIESVNDFLKNVFWLEKTKIRGIEKKRKSPEIYDKTGLCSWLGWLDSNQRNAGVKVLCLTGLATSQRG